MKSTLLEPLECNSTLAGLMIVLRVFSFVGETTTARFTLPAKPELSRMMMILPASPCSTVTLATLADIVKPFEGRTGITRNNSQGLVAGLFSESPP
jgi:hypothetical protein